MNPINSFDMVEFVNGYIACAFWSETDDDGEPLDANYGEADLTPDTRRDIETDCRDFVAANLELLDAATDRDGYGWARAGQDFWLTRNGHGAGYWDRDVLKADELGEQLSKACGDEACELYIGDDGRVYLSGAGAFSEKQATE